jgi:hypothetical protein
MKKIIEKILNWFRRSKKKTLAEMYQDAHPEPIKSFKPGRGLYFKNNRKRTRGRNIQYIQLANGGTRVIKHETL